VIEAPLNASVAWVEAEIEVGYSCLVLLDRDVIQSLLRLRFFQPWFCVSRLYHSL